MWAQFISFLLLTILAFKLSPIPESADLGQILIGVGILGLGAMLGIATIIPCIRRLREKIAVLERNLDVARKDGNKNWGLYRDESAAHARTKEELAATEAELGNARHQLINAWGATGETTVSDHDLTLAQAIQQRLMDHRQEIARLEHQLNIALYAAAVFEEEMEKLHDEADDRQLDAFLQGADHYSELEIQERIEQARIYAYEAALLNLYTEVFDDGRRDAYEGMVDTPTAKQVVAGLFDTILDLERQLGEALDLLNETAEANWKHGFATAASLLDEEVDGLVEALVLQVVRNVLLERDLEGALTALDDSIKHWMGRWAKAYKDYRAEQKDHWQTQHLLDEALATANRAYARGVFTVLGALPIDPAVIASVALSLPSHLYDMMAVADGHQPGYRPIAKAPTFTPNPADVQNAVLGLVIADYGSVAPHFLRLLHEADDANGFGGLLPGGD